MPISLTCSSKPREFFNTAWSKTATAHLSPNLLAEINLFNHVSQWVGTIIVSNEKVRERAKLMTRCIKIAQVAAISVMVLRFSL